MTVSVTFYLSEAEHVAAVRTLQLREPTYIVVSTVMLAFLSLFAALTAMWFSEYSTWVLPWLCAALPVLWGLHLYLLPRQTVRRIRSGGAMADGPHTVTLRENGFVVESPFSSGEIAWAAVPGALETTKFFFLSTSGLSSQIVPKRVLSPQALCDTRDILRRRLGRRARPKGSAPVSVQERAVEQGDETDKAR